MGLAWVLPEDVPEDLKIVNGCHSVKHIYGFY